MIGLNKDKRLWLLLGIVNISKKEDKVNSLIYINLYLMKIYKIPFGNVINMDEMCLSCDPSVKSTYSPVGKE